MKNKRGMSAWVWILIVVVLVLIGVGVYLWLAGSSISTPSALSQGVGIRTGNSIPSPPALPS